MLEVAAADIKQLGGSVELADIGKQKVRGRHLGVTEPWGAGLPEGLVGLSTFLSHLASGNLLVFKTNRKGPIWVLNCAIPSVGLGQSFCNTLSRWRECIFCISLQMAELLRLLRNTLM